MELTHDDSAEFRHRMCSVYSSLEAFQTDFREFQRLTCTSFFIYNSLTNEAAKRRGLELSHTIPYYYIKYCCVHRRRKGGNSSKYQDVDCHAFLTLRAIGSSYSVVSWSMKHSHSFHIGNGDLYVSNRRLTQDQEDQVFRLMGTIRNGTALREYAQKEFNRRLTRQDIMSLKMRQSKKNSLDEAEGVKQMLRGHGYVDLTCEGGRIKYVIFIPFVSKALSARFSDVMLTGSAHQVKLTGYFLWHIMVVDNAGIGHSLLYALLPDKTSASYRRAVTFMSEVLPQTRFCKTIIVDRTLGEVNAFSDGYPNLRVIFCRRRIISDMRLKCSHLEGTREWEKRCIFQCMRNMVLAVSKKRFERFRMAITARNSEAAAYLNKNWMPLKAHWAGYLVSDCMVLGEFTIDRVDAEYRYLEAGLSNCSTASAIFGCIFERVRSLETSNKPADGQTCYSAPAGQEWLQPLLVCLTDYARGVLLAHLRTQHIVSIRCNGETWFVKNSRDITYRVSLTNTIHCECPFSRQWDLPCLHFLGVAKETHLPFHEINLGRWSTSTGSASFSSPTTSSEIQPSQDPVASAVDRWSDLERVTKNLVASLVGLNEENFQCWISQLDLLPQILAVRPDVKMLFELPGSCTPVAVEKANDVLKLLHNGKENIVESHLAPSTSCENEPAAVTAMSDGDSNNRSSSNSRRKTKVCARNIASDDLGELWPVPSQCFQSRTKTESQLRSKRGRLASSPVIEDRGFLTKDNLIVDLDDEN